MRIALNILLLVAVVNGWWFVAIPLGIVGAWFFAYYFELIVAGLIYDALFGMIPVGCVWQYTGTALTVIIFVLIIHVKRIIR